MLKQKGIAPIIIALIIAIAGLGVYQIVKINKSENIEVEKMADGKIEEKKEKVTEKEEAIDKTIQDEVYQQYGIDVSNSAEADYNCKDFASKKTCVHSGFALERHIMGYPDFEQIGNNQTYAVINGIRKKVFTGRYHKDNLDENYSASFCVSQDLNNYVYTLKNGLADYYVIWNDKQYGPYSQIKYGCAISNNSKNVFWTATEQGKDIIFKNGEKYYEMKIFGKNSEKIILIDPNLDIFIYSSYKNSDKLKYYFVKNGKEMIFDDIRNISYYQNWTKMFFACENNDMFAVCDQDGQSIKDTWARPAYKDISYNFSPNLKQMILLSTWQGSGKDCDHNYIGINGKTTDIEKGFFVVAQSFEISDKTNLSKMSFFIGKEKKEQPQELIDPNHYKKEEVNDPDYFTDYNDRLFDGNELSDRMLLIDDMGNYAYRIGNRANDRPLCIPDNGTPMEYIIHNGKKYGPYKIYSWINEEDGAILYYYSESIKLIDDDVYYVAKDWLDGKQKTYKNGVEYSTDFDKIDWSKM